MYHNKDPFQSPNWILSLMVLILVIIIAVFIGQQRSDNIVKPEQERSEQLDRELEEVKSSSEDVDVDELWREGEYTREGHRNAIKRQVDLTDSYFGHEEWQSREEIVEAIEE